MESDMNPVRLIWGFFGKQPKSSPAPSKSKGRNPIMDEHILNKLAALDSKWRREKIDLAERIKREAEIHLAGMEEERATLAAEASRLGFSKGKIGKALRTTDWRTISEVIERGMAKLEDLPVAAHFTWGYVHYNGPDRLFAWVVVDGEDIETTFAGTTHPGHAVAFTDVSIERRDSVVMEPGGFLQTFRSNASGLALDILDWARENKSNIPVTVVEDDEPVGFGF